MRLVRVLPLVVLAACAWNPPARQYPAWTVTEPASRSYLCGTATPTVVKTGKTGIGVTFTFDGRDAECSPAIDELLLVIEGKRVASAKPPGPLHVAPGGRVAMYFALPFDQNGSYDEGDRHGLLVLRGPEATLEFPIDLGERAP